MSGGYKQDEVYPLHKFPQDKQDEIAALVALDHPPPRWIRIGPCQMPSRAWWEWHWQRGIHPGLKRGRLGANLRASIIRRDGLTCGLCGGDVELADVHIDHILPVARGGEDVPSNLRVTHSLCNMKKGARVDGP